MKLQRPCTACTARETGTTSCPTFGGDDLVPLVAVSTVMGTSAAHLGQTFFLHLSLKWRQTSRKLFFSLVCSMYGVCPINLDIQDVPAVAWVALGPAKRGYTSCVRAAPILPPKCRFLLHAVHQCYAFPRAVHSDPGLSGGLRELNNAPV